MELLKEAVEIFEDCGGTIEDVFTHVVETTENKMDKQLAGELAKAIIGVKRNHEK